MNESAQRFVTPLTFQTLSGRAVLTTLWEPILSDDPQHIELTEHADIFLIAPATADTIAKIAHGLADSVVSTLASAAVGPMLLAPSMNNHMWQNPANQSNIARLREWGRHIVGPESGWLACRNEGPGRMSEPEQILAKIDEILSAKPK
jgi:phosphopantothenoylcysteine decarboxylase/phosphopantothenate--cysteine ligase